MAPSDQINQFLRQLAAKQQALQGQQQTLEGQLRAVTRALEEQPRSITQEIDAIPGRRIFYNLVAEVSFTVAQAGTRGQPVSFLVSQDGPFIMTHYPVAMWRPNQPLNADNFGRWRPVYSWPLPDQVLDTDIVDLSYEMVDAGSQRNFQNAPSPPLLSRPDAALPLPVPTLFAPNSTIQFVPTFEAINFITGGTVDTTGGELVVMLPGYKIVNL
jgi:hypothetical protein